VLSAGSITLGNAFLLQTHASRQVSDDLLRHKPSGVARVWSARAALEFGAPEAYKNTYCTV